MAISYERIHEGTEEVPIEVYISPDIDTESAEWAGHLASPIEDLSRFIEDIDDSWTVTTAIVKHGFEGRKILAFGSKVTLVTTVVIDSKVVHEQVHKGPNPVES